MLLGLAAEHLLGLSRAPVESMGKNEYENIGRTESNIQSVIELRLVEAACSWEGHGRNV